MKDFISVHDALPGLNCLVEYKYRNGHVSTTRIGMDTKKPFLVWIGLPVEDGTSLRIPDYLTHWRYVIEDEEERRKEAEEWLASLPQVEHLDSTVLDNCNE